MPQGAAIAPLATLRRRFRRRRAAWPGRPCACAATDDGRPRSATSCATKFAPDAIQTRVVDASGHAPSGPGFRFAYAPPWELCHLRDVTEAARAERSRQFADAWRGDDQPAAGDTWNAIKADWEQKLAQATAEDDAEAAREARKAITAMAWRTPPAAFAPECARAARSGLQRRDASGRPPPSHPSNALHSFPYARPDHGRPAAGRRGLERKRARDLAAWQRP